MPPFTNQKTRWRLFATGRAAAARELADEFEIVLVNDGCPGHSLDLALDICKHDSAVRVVDLSRNFGHHQAMMAGLRASRGDHIFLIDSDLEEPPELLLDFHSQLMQRNVDVVYGVQRSRKGHLAERFGGRIFFFVFNLLSDVQLPNNVSTVRLMTRRYVDALVLHEERETIIAGLWVITGFSQYPVAIEKSGRSRTTYGFWKRASALVSAITAFSNRPLRYIFYLGCLIIAGSTIAAVNLMIRKLVYGIQAAGWTSVIVSVWLLGGITIFCLGVIGIYLSKIFMETKKRPHTIVRAEYGTGGHEVTPSGKSGSGA